MHLEHLWPPLPLPQKSPFKKKGSFHIRTNFDALLVNCAIILEKLDQMERVVLRILVER